MHILTSQLTLNTQLPVSCSWEKASLACTVPVLPREPPPEHQPRFGYRQKTFCFSLNKIYNKNGSASDFGFDR
jgi:hypothetical protein